MSDPIFIVVLSATTGLPLSGLTPSFAAPGFYRTPGQVAVTPPVITDRGDGSYTFLPSDNDVVSGIQYLMDAGDTAYPRFYSGAVESAASAAATTIVSPTNINVFGVTHDTVRKHHFPQWSAFTGSSNPSAATITEKILECAGELSAKLEQEGMDALSIITVNSPAYVWCQKTLKLMAAIEILTVATQAAPPISAKWQDWLTARWTELDDKGHSALGDGVATPATEADGPTHHIAQLGIDVGDPALDAGPAIPPFRSDDAQ